MVSKKIQWWEWVALALIVAGGAWLRWYEIGDKSIWLDESFSLWMARQSIPDLFGWITKIDQHPFLYYLSMHFWAQLGSDETTLRSFSAIFSTLTIPVMYFTARRLLGVGSAIFAAALLAFSAFNVHYAQEARMYALLCFNVTMVMLALAYLFTGDERRRWWAVYAVFSTLVLFTHNVAVLFPVAVNVGYLFVLGTNRITSPRPSPGERENGETSPRPSPEGEGEVQGTSPRPSPGERENSETSPRPSPGERENGETSPQPSPEGEGDIVAPRLKHWLLGQLAMVILWLPWAPSFVRQMLMVDNEFWIPPPTLDFVIHTFGNWVVDWKPWGENWMLWAALAALILAVIALVKRPALLLFLLTLIVLPIALNLLVSLRRPIFYDRTLIFVTLPWLLLLSASVGVWVRQPARRLRLLALPGAAALIVLMAGNIVGLQNYYDNFHKEEWREAAAWVADRVGENDALLFNATWIQLPFEYYFDRAGKDVAKMGAPVDLFDAGVLEPKMTEEDIDYLINRIHEYNCVWLVYSHDWYTDPKGLVPRTMRYNMVGGQQKDFVGLKVLLYQNRDYRERCGQINP